MWRAPFPIWKVRSVRSAKIFTVEFTASVAPPHHVIIRDSDGNLVKTATHGSGNFVFEDLVVSVRERRHGTRVRAAMWAAH